MKKYVVLSLAVLVMALVVAAAFVVDCLRIDAAAEERVALVDRELIEQEQRLIALVEGSERISPEVREAIATYKKAAGREASHADYEKLIAQFRQTMLAKVDPTNPLARRFMDDVAGAINRREVILERYRVEKTVYDQLASSFRGSVARRFAAPIPAAEAK